MDDWVGDSDFSAGSEEEEDTDRKKKKRKNEKKKDKKNQESDSSAKEESDEGDFDDREVDYMTSGSDSSDQEPEDAKANKQLKGVEDEDALRQLVLSDEEEEEEEQKKEEGEEENKNGKPYSSILAPPHAPTLARFSTWQTQTAIVLAADGSFRSRKPTNEPLNETVFPGEDDKNAASKDGGNKDEKEKKAKSSDESSSESSDSDFDDQIGNSALFMQVRIVREITTVKSNFSARHTEHTERTEYFRLLYT